MPFDYDIPFRPNYDAYALIGWALAIPVAYLAHTLSDLPPLPFQVMVLVCGGMILARTGGAYRCWRRTHNLKGQALAFYTPKALGQRLRRYPDHIWYGEGFEWTKAHAQNVYEITRNDHRQMLPKARHSGPGEYWLHGLEDPRRHHAIVQPKHEATLMTLLVGTTGAGKTRMFETLITQAILRHEPVIIIDPKGDRALCETARRACALVGEPERFVYVHPANPSASVRLDPCYNFNQPTEIASRISAVVPQGADSGPFVAYGFMAMNNIVQGLIFSGERPNLVKIRRFMEGGPDQLVVRAVEIYAAHVLSDGSTLAASYLRQAQNTHQRAQGLARFYNEVIQPQYPNADLEGLLAMFNHNREHFGKMIASTLPILNMLTSGDIGPLLSPDPHADDPRPFVETARIIRDRKVCYIGLDSLSNVVVADAIGSIFLADLASVAGARYNEGTTRTQVNVFIDEAAQCVNDPLIQLLNKGRGSGFSLYLATQTFADFAAKLGDEHKARQVLANLNNLIALRTIDPDTQEYIIKNLPMTRIDTVMRTQGNTTESGLLMAHGGHVGERLVEAEADLFPPQLLGQLPNLEYIAKLAGGRLYKGRIPILEAE